MCSLSSIFHNNKIKYSTSTIKTGKYRNVAKWTAIKRRQEKVRVWWQKERTWRDERWQYKKTKWKNVSNKGRMRERGVVAWDQWLEYYQIQSKGILTKDKYSSSQIYLPLSLPQTLYAEQTVQGECVCSCSQTMLQLHLFLLALFFSSFISLNTSGAPSTSN